MDIENAFHAALPNSRWGRAGGNPVWVVIADSREWGAWRGEALRLLDDQQRLRVERMRNLEARETLIIAYALHRIFLGRYLGMPTQAVPLWRDALGCPRVGDGMAATSLSHAGFLVALAVGEFFPLGVDIEPASRAGGMEDIAESICQPAELDAMLRLPVTDRHAALLSLWTGKEAVLKASGLGFSAGEMNQFALPIHPEPYVDERGQTLRITNLYQASEWTCAVASAFDAPVEFSRVIVTTWKCE